MVDVFRILDRSEPMGSILVKDMCDVSFLFCNHPLYPKRVDEDYEEEYQAAGLDHACALFSYEDLEMGKLSLYGEEISGLTIYRGWILHCPWQMVWRAPILSRIMSRVGSMSGMMPVSSVIFLIKQMQKGSSGTLSSGRIRVWLEAWSFGSSRDYGRSDSMRRAVCRYRKNIGSLCLQEEF